MSYQKRKTGNSMNDYFTRLRDFYLLVPNLEKAETPRTFELWLDKLVQIDRRSLILWLRKHQKTIPEDYWKKAVRRMQELEG